MPHRLYGHVDAAENYSVGAGVADAAAALDEAARAQSGLPIFVGGTGLYFKALTHGLAAVPPMPAGGARRACGAARAQGVEALHAELAQRDPAMRRRLSRRDRARITRALEVVMATGRSLADWQREACAPLLDAGCAARVFLAPERDDVYAAHRCALRRDARSRARSTKSRRLRRAGSIRCCRR